MTPHFVERERPERFIEVDTVRRRMNCYVRCGPLPCWRYSARRRFAARASIADRSTIARARLAVPMGPAASVAAMSNRYSAPSSRQQGKGSHDSAWSGSVGTARMSAGRIR
ncbi:hypothetical protein BG57_32650 [Caballeronia grimmiae]|uniref:Uncharacterized protein n=1 Tax=Caballeronia grimmiae TaxID=1071679 RepID=A0A069P5L4_9BURK|nr:hypothetical protein BG57_32650 [Caballeronia grimmiae]